MKKTTLFILCIAAAFGTQAQAVLNSWIMNTNGKLASYWANNASSPNQAPNYVFTNTTDSADALKVCYNSDTVWVYSHNMTDNMGKWLNPGSAAAQNFIHRFPRNPVVPATPILSPKGGEIGLLINGIVIYGIGDANSWSGTANTTPQQGGLGIWNREVGIGEGVSLDTAFGGHPQQQGVYHSHLRPRRLYENVPTTQHSPIVGWAFDGYPVYGPYGYASPLDTTSGTTRMKSGYSLRNITTRTTMPDGSTASQTGPDVSATYPLGTYCEDYEWLAANGGDLDANNGRFCITPEFPQGTYAYFVTLDLAGNGQFPYYIGINYHGTPDASNFPNGPQGNQLTSIPSYLSSCILPVSTAIGNVATRSSVLQIVPNPAIGGQFTIIGNGHSFSHVTVMNMMGQKVYEAALNGQEDSRISIDIPGVYLVRCENALSHIASVQRMVVE